ncbi:hypothetical protein OTU49_009656 [Cherax quadricarinatus]|uniref:GH18 domain-containing protein n=1 Tax=Cherax quadricarinatus TaxID=27406 RepID=A0AAW0WJR4_CHEQU
MASQFVRSNTRKIIILGLIWILVMIVLSYCGCDVYNSSLKHDDHESSSDHVLLPLKEYKNYLENENSTDKKILCYYSIPQNGSSETPLTAKDIDSTLCTHIIISKAKIENTTIVPVDEGDFKVYAEVVAMKKQNPDLYVLLSLATGFSSLVQDRIAVAVFAYNAHKFLTTHGFDGLDLDWEFPAWPPGKKNPKEKTWFTYLLLQLNNALKMC